MSANLLTNYGNLHQVTFTLVNGTLNNPLQLPNFYPSSRIVGLTLVNLNNTPQGTSTVPTLGAINWATVAGGGNNKQANATVTPFSSANDVSTYKLEWVNVGGVWAT